jgi:branched-chain amino acid transport system substrate-binding protein
MVTRDLVVATTFGANILFCLLTVALTAHKRTSSKRKIGRTGEVSRKTAWHEKPSRGQNSPETNDRNDGRKITLISFDDGYSPPKTVEQTRKLVEREQVAFSSLGTAPNLAIRKYLNEHKVPQILTATGADQFSDPEHFPWTTPYVPSFGTEGTSTENTSSRTSPTHG